MKMEEKLENISILNVACFVLYGFSNVFDNMKLLHASFVGVLISFIISTYLLGKTRQMKNEVEKRVLIRCINSLVFCLFFFVCYALTIFS